MFCCGSVVGQNVANAQKDLVALAWSQSTLESASPKSATCFWMCNKLHNPLDSKWHRKSTIEKEQQSQNYLASRQDCKQTLLTLNALRGPFPLALLRLELSELFGDRLEGSGHVTT